MKFKILTIVGARPHFIKAVMVSKAITEKTDLQEILVHTGQHYDYQLSQSFFEELDLPTPKYNLEIGSGRASWQMGKILLGLDEIIQQEAPDMIIVYGDTNSTAAAAIAAAQNNIPLAHIEAGLREHDKSIPEEVNNLLTDAVSDLFFCPTQTGVDNLQAAGQTEGVHLVGDVGIDLIYANDIKIRKAASVLDRWDLASGEYYFMTCHRASNTASPEPLLEILSAASALDAPVLFAMHPRTRQAIDTFKLGSQLDHPNIFVSEPLGFWPTQALIQNAKMVLTDSGGIIKEAYFHQVPAVILDTQSEWVETIAEGWNYLAGPDCQKILERVHTFVRPATHANALGDGTAAIQIIDIISDYLNA